MTRRATGAVYRPTVTTNKNGKRKSRKAKFYWVRYRDARGEQQCHALKLPNGMRVTDKGVARSELDNILQRIEREAAGLIDQRLESANMPMRTVLARYIRYLRRKKCTPRHIDQVLKCIKWAMAKVNMHRLADLNEDRVDKALGYLSDMGRSARTVNVYRRCLGSMAEWAVKLARILDRNPVRAVERRNEDADKRKVRRSLTFDEGSRLLEVSGASRLFYHVQLWAGLRVGETAALEWRDLILDGDRPALLLRAETTKSRMSDDLPLHPSLALALTEAKPAFAKPNDAVFDTTPTLETFKAHLELADIPFEDGRGRTVDRHALRTTFISWLGLSAVDPRAQIVLARHAPKGVTFKSYMDFSLIDLWTEIRKLPAPRLTSEIDTQCATGTADRASSAVARWVAPKDSRRGVNVSAIGHNGGSGRGVPTARKLRQNQHLQPVGGHSSAGYMNTEVCQTGRTGPPPGSI